jgi:hypothetical protein
MELSNVSGNPMVEEGGSSELPTSSSSFLSSSLQGNLDSSPDTPELMKQQQAAFFESKLPSNPNLAHKAVAIFFSRNLLPDVMLPSALPPSALPYWKYIKFLLITYASMYGSRNYAIHHGASYDAVLTEGKFITGDFWNTVTDATLVYLIGRLHSRRGIDCFNFLFPMFLGCVVWEEFGKVPDLGYSLADSDEWKPITYVVFIAFMLLIAGQLGGHFYKMYHDGLLPGRVAELVLLVALTLGPLIGNKDFHLHHWTWAWIGAMTFNLRYSWSFALQGFMWGMYCNGIGIWGRDPVLSG